MSDFERIIPPAAPEEVGLSRERLSRVDGLISQACERGDIPGAVVAVAKRGRRVLYRAFGLAARHPEERPMSLETPFDLASLTKVTATLPTLLSLLEDGLLRLDDPVAVVIPEFAANGKERITFRQILSHQSGLIWWRDFYARYSGYDEIISAICAEGLDYPTGSKVVYSDLGYILMTEVVRRLSGGQTLDQVARERVFAPLAMAGACYNPPPEMAATAAATEYRPERCIWQCGEVHDENAGALGGVSGHAGLFATAADVLLYGQAWLNGGCLPAAGRILSPATVRAATVEQTPGLDARRAIGWDLKARELSSAGDLFSMSAYGHTGFTGTSLWIDPALDLVAVLLTNRVHPTRANQAIIRLRPRFHNLLAAAIVE